jgi:hypothetical protein
VFTLHNRNPPPLVASSDLPEIAFDLTFLRSHKHRYTLPQPPNPNLTGVATTTTLDSSFATVPTTT